MRILGVDFGDARTGIAVSDEGARLAGGVATVFTKGLRAAAAEIKKQADFYKAGIIVVGLPKNMDNTIGPRGEKTLKLISLVGELCEGSARVVPWDERLTTAGAAAVLNLTNTRGKKRKAVIDTLAAEMILQSYLDFQNK